MNLSGVLDGSFSEDHSLVDHGWLGDTESVIDLSLVKKTNDIKPQLELEWGLSKGTSFDIDDPVSTIETNSEDNFDNSDESEKVVFFARDLMNRGFRGSKVVEALRKKYPQESLRKASDGLRDMFAFEGIVGRIMVDARGYKDCHSAMKSASASPYKRFIKHVYGCTCGDPHMIPENDLDVIGDNFESTGDSIQDFFASESAPKKMIAHCASIRLPIYAGGGDLDPSFVDSTLIDMNNLGMVAPSVVASIQNRKISNVAKIKAAFEWIDQQMDDEENGQYAEPVDNQEFKIQEADNELEIFDAPEEYVAPDSLEISLDDVDVMDEGAEQLPIELMDETSEGQIGLEDEASIFEPISIDEQPGSVSFDIEESIPDIEFIPEQFKEPEFEGIDEYEIEEEKIIPSDLQISMKQDQEIEL